MFKDEKALLNHIAQGGRIGAGDDVSIGYRGELTRLMAVFVDSELAGAAGFADRINSAPGIREKVVAARVVSEKLAHADAVLGLMARFGVNPQLYVRAHAWAARLDRDTDLGLRRIGGDKRLNVFHYPLEGWTDAVAMNLLMSTASGIQLAELGQCSYLPLADCMQGIVARETEHARLGEAGLRQCIERAGSKTAAQASVDYWFPRVAATFGRTDSEHLERYRGYGLRQRANADQHDAWRADIAPRLQALGLTLPRSV